MVFTSLRRSDIKGEREARRVLEVACVPSLKTSFFMIFPFLSWCLKCWIWLSRVAWVLSFKTIMWIILLWWFIMILSYGNLENLHWMRQSFKTWPPACSWLPIWVRTSLWCCPLCCPLLPKPIWNDFHGCCGSQSCQIYNVDSECWHASFRWLPHCTGWSKCTHLCGNIQQGDLFPKVI